MLPSPFHSLQAIKAERVRRDSAAAAESVNAAPELDAETIHDLEGARWSAMQKIMAAQMIAAAAAARADAAAAGAHAAEADVAGASAAKATAGADAAGASAAEVDAAAQVRKDGGRQRAGVTG